MAQPDGRTYKYRHIWPIVDDGRPLSALRVEAAAALDALAARQGARLVGVPEWTVSGDRLYCEAPAVPVPVPERGVVDEAAVVRLAEFGWSDTQIASELGCGRRRVADIRLAAGLEPGSGVRELVDEVAVEQALRGDQGIALNVSERDHAIRLMHQRGASTAEIAARLHLSTRHIHRLIPQKTAAVT